MTSEHFCIIIKYLERHDPWMSVEAVIKKLIADNAPF